ncbi:uncharacterized protein [Palaemon carinicauda]|uniref:uncharacterized protein n=1 Tax=Palaemon carinicauda TaxID=392227 RepID=UPI0035B5E2B9
MKPRGKMYALHLVVYIVLQFSIECHTTVGQTQSCKTSCFIQADNDDIRENGACIFDYHMTSRECATKPSSDFDMTQNSDGNNINFLRMASSPIDAFNTAVDFSLKVNVTGEVFLFISGVTDRKEFRCLSMCFKRRRDWQTSILKASCVKFPNGKYSVLAIAYDGIKAEGVTCNTLKKQILNFSRKDAIVLSRSDLSLTTPISAVVNPSGKKIHRTKRVGDRSRMSMSDILNLPETPGIQRCPCYTCLNTQHHYNNETALLQLSYSINATNACCTNCSSLNLVLYQYVSVYDEQQCIDLNFTTSVISGLRLVTTDKNVTQGPIEYPNTDNGCYAFRLRPMVNPSPIYHGFFWLTPSGNVTNMNDWNTTFFLQPYPETESLEVKWTAPTYPYNFSSYELQLWHHRSIPIKCRGEDVYTGPIMVIPDSGKISLTSTSFNFQNLSSGWYCARVTPVDPRCPPDGCEPRSSLARLLKESEDCCGDEEQVDKMGPLLAGAAAGVLLAGTILACVVARCRASHNFFNVAYTKVTAGVKLGDIQEVLLVWTAAGPDGAHLAPVMQALKKVLTSYGRCKVYDYLDLTSLPPPQREHLLSSPTSWLDSLLTQHRIKVLIVGTEGGRYRQLQWKTSSGVTSEVVSNLQPLDAQLFPYLLRRLQDKPDLATDYSRVFHVRFSDISTEGAELEGVVSWTRYHIPQHLRSLILALHGIKEEEGSCLEDPSPEILQTIHGALTNHPLYASRSTRNNNSTGNHCNSSPSTDLNDDPSLSQPFISQTNNTSTSKTIYSLDKTPPSNHHVPKETVDGNSLIANNYNCTSDGRANLENVPPSESTVPNRDVLKNSVNGPNDSSQSDWNQVKNSLNHPDSRLSQSGIQSPVKTNGIVK